MDQRPRFHNRADPVGFVWVDLRNQRTAPSFYQDVCGACLRLNEFTKRQFSSRKNSVAPSFPAHCVIEITAIEPAISNHNPKFLFFEYDFPDKAGLNTLQQTKTRHPELPVLMLTTHHSEALAVWAFRTGVWDYLVKPQDPNEIAQEISNLLAFNTNRGVSTIRRPHFSEQRIPIDMQFTGPRETGKKTDAAVSYIESHFHENIRLATVARLSKLSSFQFSRVFKKEQGMTFSKYVQKYRIIRAAEIFATTKNSVGDVGFAVGFSNLSYFDRVFRKHLGVSPSQFLREIPSDNQSPPRRGIQGSLKR